MSEGSDLWPVGIVSGSAGTNVTVGGIGKVKSEHNLEVGVTLRAGRIVRRRSG